ncbi:hypothetical protein ACH5RR_021969 [Cinchona calisaya]|uniref:Uncharacterized protein n=1 Tax=Cinchona calisaya TaxID=153742 RepID=A0ABD2Z6H3_9GENT
MKLAQLKPSFQTMASNEGHVHLDLGDNQYPGNKAQQTSSTPKPLNNSKVDRQNQTIYTLGERVGWQELFSWDVWRASMGEFLGSAVLVFMVDTIVISTYESNIKMPNLIMSIFIGISVTIVLLALFPISGGHLNPVISFSAALVGVISLSRAIVYILAQCAGSSLGALALKAVVSKTIADTFSLGGCTITVIVPGPQGPVKIGLETAQAFWLETLCTFSLLLSAVWIAFNPRLMKSLGLIVVFSIIGVVLGLLIFVSTTVTTQRGYAGAGMNPARCFGAAIVRGGHLWDGHWIFWVGPTIACFGFYFYTKIIPDEDFQAQGEKHDFLGIIRALIGFYGRH